MVEARALVARIAGGTGSLAGPLAGTMADAVRAAEVLRALAASADGGRWEAVRENP